MPMRRWWLGLLGAALLAAGLFYGLPQLVQRVEAPIVVGLLHSRTGPLAVDESPLLDAEILALEEINAAGGLLGRRLTWVVADGRSDPSTFGLEATRLLESEHATVLFGGLTSSCRRPMQDAAVAAKRLAFFPGAYEGMEVSIDLIGVGPMPNQQAIPAVSWCIESLKAKKFFLAGIADASSYAIHGVVRDQLKALGATYTGEAFVGLDGAKMPELVAAAKASGADVVVSSVVGDANKSFFKQMAAAGLTAAKLPIVSLRVSEDDLRQLPVDETVGHYAGWAYFQSLDGEVNQVFVERFRAKYGSDRPTSDPVVSAYQAVKLWAQAVEDGESLETGEVRDHLSRQSLEGAQGVVSIDHDLLHVWRSFHLGRIRRDGQFDVVWSLPRPIRPEAYPVFRSRADWEAALVRWTTDGEAARDEPRTRPRHAPRPRAGIELVRAVGGRAAAGGLGTSGDGPIARPGLGPPRRPGRRHDPSPGALTFRGAGPEALSRTHGPDHDPWMLERRP
ncbi:urea ABC transporter substrate-binding protein [Planctomyces sp. SH-PL62]|uniref:urea ABC transporter substrate-binding protein n=1 Tax=Planctomyces sp. SH-PL62 TaxID=1636152 RepID=UPI00078CC840|nr:urea ABC transporter substrate-binding protein [Planctomyces sp. SH-PL62]AMV37851.1 Aliphatic amidase expression-regulating protein [Planctomyces sp. SH-PL62]